MIVFDYSFCSDQLVRTESICKEENPLIFDQPPEICLWERLGNAASLDIESSDFSWSMLSSLHHTEHSSSSEHSEDETNKALEVSWVLFLSTIFVFAVEKQPNAFIPVLTISEVNLYCKVMTD